MSRLPAVVRLRPALHPGQVQFWNLTKQHRFALATCGRRFGKTLFLHQHGTRFAINHQASKVWWIDPIHYLAKRAFRDMSKVLLRSGLAESSGVLKSDLRIELITGSVVEFHSAERGDRMRGEGVHLVLVNEASLIKKAVWFEIIYPMLTDTQGSACFAFTPKGQGHWTHQLFQWGRSDDYPAYGSMQLPTSANPIIDPNFIRSAQRDLPASTFAQEYLAEFLEDGSGVFRNVLACLHSRPLDDPRWVPVDGPYVGGLDLARDVDYTVLHIMDRHGRVVWHDRCQRLDWPIIKARLIEACLRYRVHLLAEYNSMGQTIIDDLREAGVSVDAFNTSNASKQDLIQGLMVALEQGLISYPDLPELLTELQIFEYNRLPSGAIRYAAPEGAHDDEVVALALATRAYKQSLKAPRDSFLGGVDLAGLVAGRKAA